jgi:uncharacterized protein YndB with AHSA1/START domain
MNRSATHATFTIERIYNATPQRVFNAFTNLEAKSQWFTGGGEWEELRREDDFVVGGAERLVGRWPDGTLSDYRSRYEEIIPNDRIIYVYHVSVNDVPITVSLATVQFFPEANGTKLIFTEQMTCLDGFEDLDGKQREQGVGLHLERLANYLERSPALR